MMEVSVCISVHNTAAYLPRCLDSVCAQTLKSLEIVLVNNGSTDNSEEIMHQYASSHPERHFVIVAQEDRGLSQGRQTGVNNASGDYIAFLDADDYVDPTAYEKLLLCAKQNNADIVEMETVREGVVLSSPFAGLHNTHEVLKSYFLQGSCKTMMLWLRIYRRELFQKPVLPTKYTNNEDNFAYPCVLHTAHTIYYLKEPLHTYSTDNESGVMLLYRTNVEYGEKYYNSRRIILSAINHITEYIGSEGMKEYESEFNVFKAKSFRAFILEGFVNKTKEDKSREIMDLMGFSSEKEVNTFIKRNIPFSFSIDGIIKIAGFNFAYKISQIKRKILK